MIEISVVIPALNEEKYIGDLLNKLRHQVFKNFEVIVVDNGSTDGTEEIATSLGASVYQDSAANISGLRNLGARKAQGHILAFLDADCIPSERWLDAAYETLANENIGVTGSHCKFDAENSSWVEKAWYSTKPKGRSRVRFVGSANLFIRKRIFDEIGGFNEELLTGEDYDLCVRADLNGGKVISNDSIEVVHLRGPKTLKERFKKEVWYGMETFNILKLNRLYLPFYASMALLCCILGFVVSVVLFNRLLLLGFVLSTMGLILAITGYRCHKAKTYAFFFNLLPINLMYLMGRSYAIVLIFGKRLLKR